MFALDTNVISELMRLAPHPAVFAWVAAQPRTSLYTASVTRAEILSGIGIMPKGRRHAALRDAAAAMFDEYLHKHSELKPGNARSGTSPDPPAAPGHAELPDGRVRVVAVERGLAGLGRAHGWSPAEPLVPAREMGAMARQSSSGKRDPKGRGDPTEIDVGVEGMRQLVETLVAAVHPLHQLPDEAW